MKKILLIGVLLASAVSFSLTYGESVSPTMCTADYSPVCATVPVQCIKAPCEPITQTFSNSCVAKTAGATTFTTGVCQAKTIPVIVGNDRDNHGCIGSAGYSWNASENKCTRSWESKKSAHQALQDGTWKLVSLNGKSIVGTGTITFSKKSFNAKLCNTVNGQYGVFKSTLMFRKVVSTRMYCEGEFMPIESILTETSRLKFVVGSDTLTITGKHGDVMVWKK